MNKLIATLLLGAMLAASPAFAQSAEETAAGKKLYVDNLRLKPQSDALKKSGVTIAYVSKDTQPGGGKYFCGAISPARLESAETEVSKAFATLPDSAWDKISLDYVLLCSETRAGDRNIGGIPVPPLKLLMLAAGNDSGNRFAQTALHELYHLIEMQHKTYKDAEWDGFFTGYNNAYGSANAVEFGSGGAGFLNSYSQSFSHEERAEIFASMLYTTQPLVQHVQKSGDEKLMQKIGFMVGKCQKLLGSDACIFGAGQ